MPGKCLRAELLNHILLKCFGSILAYLRFMAKLVFFSLNEFVGNFRRAAVSKYEPSFYRSGKPRLYNQQSSTTSREIAILKNFPTLMLLRTHG